MRNLTAKAAVLLSAAALVLGACGTNKEETPTGGGGGGEQCDTSKGTLTVGVIAPLSQQLSALGLGIRNSAELAVREHNEKCTVKGYKLALAAEDDQAIAQVAAQAASRLVSRPDLVGVIGTLNSSTSQSVQPVLAQKNIAQISPANTADSLTKGEQYAEAPKRQFETYFRACATDSRQGPVAAQHLVEKAGKKNIAVITDGKTYGVGLAKEFAAEAEKLGATIAAREQIGERDTDFSAVIAKIRGSNPDAVYYGGEYPQAGPLSKQLKAAGLRIPLMGGDGIYDEEFIKLGGSDGDLATSVGAPAEELDSAKAFIEAYEAADFSEDYSAYGAFSYDSTNALIVSLGKTVGDGEWSEDKRTELLKNIGEYKADGATGEIAFDEFGDTTNKVLTVYQVAGDAWDAVETVTVE